MPVSVFRRYTPPTCTLELQGTRSPLSIWSDRPIVKEVQFNLSIDGPHRHTEQKVTIRGDRFQLDDLHRAVSAYVQHTLTLSVDQFQSHLLGSPPSNSSQQGNTSSRSLQASSISHANQTVSRIDGRHNKSLHLSPQGLLQHQLHLGPLAGHNIPAVIVLTTTELFDLANALDTYHGELDSIPELNPGQHRRTPAPWLKVAAVAVLAVGVGTSVVRFSQTPETAESVLQSQADDSIAPAEEQAADRLPTRVELPDIPAATEALPETLPEALPEEGEGGDRPNNRNNSGHNSESTDNQNQPENRQRRNRDNQTQDENAIALNDSSDLDESTAAVETNSPPPSPDSPPPSAEAVPNTAANSAAASPPAASTPPSPTPSGTNDPSATVANPQWANQPANQPVDPMAIPPELSTIPPISADIGADILLDSSEINLSAPPTSSARSAEPESPSSPANDQNNDPNPDSSASNPSGWASGISAYPQLAEVQAYFAARWTPPPNLKQPLQYRLLLQPDGSLQQVIPLGESARSSSAIVGFPPVGEPFVSPFEGNSAPPIRLFLDSDSRVRVFLESVE
ncbi:MAG: DUF4335 domain-containing protein [Cyanothece sp. SIO2G6]|nr:DUF4335 domain-containing protein [Cyanothece sp. SIO2G6]